MVSAIEAESTEPPQRFSLTAIEIKRPTALKATTKTSLGNTYGKAGKGRRLSKATKAAVSAAKKGKPRFKATKAAISAAKTTCNCGKCRTCKKRKMMKYRAKKAASKGGPA
ncbi:hypothetical protein CHLRE_09g414700v5 [Chlamydomonas reinhardtii]|uniref:Uncharacterized protein n=1 Tax=Chlamydomonas reinhardtii TaxID=3055 RepID=A0A2K3DFX5_CHLRE|nr:uncharacterized protein CHLRE_09g414700v5 [Chlamydomonas reinhardtii]PNW79428.1 hypothetical protein CHLRE_09g414700v5 [Chlamydomonas reinhardtii]